MPYQTQLRADDPGRVGRYFVSGRIAGIPSEDPIYLGTGPDGTEVAISMLTGEWARGGAGRDRFAAEAAVAKRVPPFCAARVLDAGLEADGAYLISEYVPGQSLLEIVSAAGAMSGAELAAVAIGTATGLASIHQAGLVHGHFGPEYVILPPDGPLRVVEFAITPPYGPATPSADIYAWAQTVVFAASGRPPAAISDLDVLPAQIGELVRHCLDGDPMQRPAARAIVQALLGDATPAAGVLAEGSRRATRRSTDQFGHDGRGAGGPDDGRLGNYSAPGQPPRVVPRYAPSAAGQPGSRPPGSRPPGGRSPGAARDPRASGPASQRASRGRAPLMTEPPAAGQRPVSGQRQPARRGPSGQARSPAEARSPLDGSRPQRAGSHQHTASRRRRTGIWIGAVVVVVVLASAVVLRLTQNNRTPGSGRKAAAGPSRGSQASPTASASPPPATPSAFAGTWAGSASQGNIVSSIRLSVTVTLVTGSSDGTINYSGGVRCSGDLTLTRATSTKVVMKQTINSGRCGSGTVTFSLTGPSSADFNFIGGAKGRVVGRLTRG